MDTRYLNRYLQAFSRGKAAPIHANFDSELNATVFRKAFDSRKRKKIADEVNRLVQIAKLVEENRIRIGTANTSQCHAVCSDLMNNYKHNNLNRAGLASITIGNVLLNGTSLYDCSPESVTNELIDRGEVNTGLDMHFWITCIDMTIIDLVLPYNLHVRGHHDLAQELGVPFVCDPTVSSNPITYIPMVVDNDGPAKVDDLKAVG